MRVRHKIKRKNEVLITTHNEGRGSKNDTKKYHPINMIKYIKGMEILHQFISEKRTHNIQDLLITHEYITQDKLSSYIPDKLQSYIYNNC